MTALTVGDVRIDQVIERANVLVSPQNQFPDLTTMDARRLLPLADPRTVDVVSGQLVLSFHSWLLRTTDAVVLVDPCVGNGKHRPTIAYLDRLDTPYLDRLAALGVTPDDVTAVVSTHQHVDHVGWNTRWDGRCWVPTFRRARHLFSATEFRHFDALHRRGVRPVNHGAHEDSVLPVMAAGLARLIADDELDGYPVAAGVRLRPAPGHTPGSLVVDVDSAGERALLAGDSIHHVWQMRHPELRNHVDTDPSAAHRTRRALLDTCADTGAMLLPGHFPVSGAGWVRRAADHYQFTFVEGASA